MTNQQIYNLCFLKPGYFSMIVSCKNGPTNPIPCLFLDLFINPEVFFTPISITYWKVLLRDLKDYIYFKSPSELREKVYKMRTLFATQQQMTFLQTWIFQEWNAFSFAGIFGDFQLLLQRPMARTTPTYFRALSSRTQLNLSWYDDSGQPRAGQRAVASKYLYLQFENF